MNRPIPSADVQDVLASTSDLWEEMRGGRLLFTGGTGFFGAWLLETFVYANKALQLGAKAVVLTRNVAGFHGKLPHLVNEPCLEFVEGDVRGFAFPGGHFSHVIHGAATSAREIDPLEMVETVVDGTRRVLTFAKLRGVRKFLLISSGAVYGTQPEHLPRIPETYDGSPDPTKPSSAYGESKRIAEVLGGIYAVGGGMEVKVARCFSFSGPLLPIDAHFAFGNFLRDVLHGRPITIQGDGTSLRSYLYAGDLAAWLYTLLFKGQNGHAYNVGSEEAVSILDLAKVFCAELAFSPGFVLAKTSIADAPRHRYIPSCAKAQGLGLTQTIPLPAQIQKSFQWLNDGIAS